MIPDYIIEQMDRQHVSLTESINWQRVRVDAAIAAMQGLLAGRGWDAGNVALVATEYADKLITELQKEVAK